MKPRLLMSCLLTAVCCTTTLTSFAQETQFDSGRFDPPGADLPANDPPPSLGQQPPPPENLPPPPQGPQSGYSHVVHLGSDGNQAGHLNLITPDGRLMPVRGTIHFIQNGRVVLTARSDERGLFQAVGLRPGVYTVVAMSDAGGGTSAVQVLPFDPNAAPTAMTLNLVVAPMEDMQMLDELLGQQMLPPPLPFPPPFPAGAPGFAGGGGGGGGLGGGGLLGAALGATGIGLGAAALGSDDGDDDDDDFDPPLVSPFFP